MGLTYGANKLGQHVGETLFGDMNDSDIAREAAKPAPVNDAWRARKARKEAERNNRVVDGMIEDMWDDFGSGPDKLNLATPRAASVDEMQHGLEQVQAIDPEEHARLLTQGNTVAARQLDSMAATRNLNEQILGAILDLNANGGFSPLLSGGSRV